MPSHDNIRTTDQLIAAGLKPRTIKAANDSHPPAYISTGPDLDEALNSLGLERAPVRQPVRVQRINLAEVLILAACYVALIATLTGAITFALNALSAFAPVGAQ